MKNKQLRFVPHLMLKCKCGVWVIIGEHVEGKNQYSGILHPLPECDLFTNNGPVEYMSALRQLYESKKTLILRAIIGTSNDRIVEVLHLVEQLLGPTWDVYTQQREFKEDLSGDVAKLTNSQLQTVRSLVPISDVLPPVA